MPIYHGNKKVTGIMKKTNTGLVFKGRTLVFNNLPQQRFESSDSIQSYIVPNGVNKVHVVCAASRGYPSSHSYGLGGKVECDLLVTPKQILYIVIGAIPTERTKAVYNASDIRLNNTGILDENSLNTRLIVAGGGGNQAQSGRVGGNGGGTVGATGGNGYGGNSGGKGGTQTEGGNGGNGVPVSVGHYHNGNKGTHSLGGNGVGCGYEGYSGAGGAGWYGGGSGAADWNKNGAYTAGGGGGSSYTHPTQCLNIVHTQGANNGVGYITITPIF